MGSITLQIPIPGQPNSTEDPKVASDFTTIQNVINGGLDSTNLSSSANIAQSQLAIGAWLPLTINVVGATVGTGDRTPSARAYGDVAQLRGFITLPAGGLAAGAGFVTLPTGTIPLAVQQPALAVVETAGGAFSPYPINILSALSSNVIQALATAPGGATITLDTLQYMLS